MLSEREGRRLTPGEALAEGHLRVRLHGDRLAGDWVLRRTAMGGEDRHWLLQRSTAGAPDARRPATDER